jgi:hypothetical protein
MDRFQHMNAGCKYPASSILIAVSTRRSASHHLRKASLILLAISAFLISLQPLAPISIPVGNAQSPAILSLEIEAINVTIAKWQKVTINGNRILHLTS